MHMYDDFAPVGRNQWWRDPFTARRVARWSLPVLVGIAGLSALLGRIGALLAALVLFALPVMAFFEARGSLFVLQYATSAYGYTPRRFPPKWWPWLAAIIGAIVLLVAGGNLAGWIGGKVGDVLTAMTLTGAGGLFLGGLFTLLGYYLDKELVAWVDRAGEEEMSVLEKRQRGDAPSTKRNSKRWFRNPRS